MQTVLCFGDSNTYGTVPMRTRESSERYAWGQRWPSVTQAALGPQWRVIEEGLGGRTMGRDDPVEGADRNALRYLPACLQSHRPLDAVVIMLGTNDCKARFGLDGRSIGLAAHALIDCVWHNTLNSHARPWLLLVAPPPLREVGCLADMFQGGAAKCAALRDALQEVAGARQVAFLDAGLHAGMGAEEGIHMDLDGHAALGQAIARRLSER